VSRQADLGRVVITGLGAISCLGVGADVQFQKASLCQSGISSFSNSLPIPVDLTCAGLVTVDLSTQFDNSMLGMYDRVAQLSWPR